MRAFAVPRLPTAFANAPSKGKKRPRAEDTKHLDWLRTLPCIITGTRPVDAAHIRYGDRAWGKRETGGAEKPDDCWCLPLCRQKHDEQHSGDERVFWARHGLDPLKLASALFHNTGDDEQASVILNEAWAAVRSFGRCQEQSQ